MKKTLQSGTNMHGGEEPSRDDRGALATEFRQLYYIVDKFCDQNGHAAASVLNPASIQMLASLITTRYRSLIPTDVPWKVLLFLSFQRDQDTRSASVSKAGRASKARRKRSGSHQSSSFALAAGTNASRPTGCNSLNQSSRATTHPRKR